MPKTIESIWARLINAQDPTRDVRLLGFLAGVVASIVWLSITLRTSMGNGWLTAYGIFMGSVSIGGAAWTILEGKNSSVPNGTPNKGQSDASESAQDQGTANKGGTE